MSDRVNGNPDLKVGDQMALEGQVRNMNTLTALRIGAFALIIPIAPVLWHWSSAWAVLTQLMGSKGVFLLLVGLWLLTYGGAVRRSMPTEGLFIDATGFAVAVTPVYRALLVSVHPTSFLASSPFLIGLNLLIFWCLPLARRLSRVPTHANTTSTEVAK